MADFKIPFSNTPGVEYKGQVYSVRGARLAALHELFGGSASVGPTQPTLSDLVDKAEQVAMILGWQPDGALPNLGNRAPRMWIGNRRSRKPTA